MAFPTTAILDNFDRADNPSLGAAWTTPVFFGNLAPRIVGNKVGPDTDSGNSYTSAWWNGATFLDSEVYLTIGTVVGARRELYTRLDSENTTAEDGYALVESFLTANEWGIYNVFAGSANLLGIVFTQSYASGDAFGLEAVGANPTTIKAYFKASGGSWAQVGVTQSNSQAANQDAGHIGFALQESASPRIDDFGGGTIITGAPPVQPGPALPTAARISYVG